MSILFLLIPLGLLLLGIAVWAFFWAASSGQFDDLSTPALSVVMDDDERPDSSAGARERSEEHAGARIAGDSDQHRKIARDAGSYKASTRE